MQKNQFYNQPINKAFSLAAATAASLLLFSFLGAPFVRVLAHTVRSSFFWAVGIVLVSTLFVFNLSTTSVYVGAIWMTLGFYSELEKRGLSWKKIAPLALFTGLIFATGLFAYLSKGSVESEIVKSVVDPLILTLKKLFPEQSYTAENILPYMPGAFLSVLLSALAVSFIFESNVFRLFNLKREKRVVSIRWLEFKLPDLFIWVALMSFFFSMVGVGIPQVKLIAINATVVCLVAFFFQGIANVEFFARVYRVGVFTKAAIYMMIFAWLGPLISLIGLVDYWIDFRKILRKKLK